MTTTNKLTGSEKQIAWASELLEGAIDELSTLISALQSAGDTANADRLSEVKAAISAATSAHVVIDSKELSQAVVDATTSDCRSRRSIMRIARKTSAAEWPKERFNAAWTAFDAAYRLIMA